MGRKATDVAARNGDIIHVGDIVQTVQDTTFLVVDVMGVSLLSCPDGLFDLEPFMSPNLWIIGDIDNNPDLCSWI